jgi:hypothetical protein
MERPVSDEAGSRRSPRAAAWRRAVLLLPPVILAMVPIAGTGGHDVLRVGTSRAWARRRIISRLGRVRPDSRKLR